MIRRAKKVELMRIVFSSKVILTLKMMDFENVALTKVVHI
jgi:hypothetical protein